MNHKVQLPKACIEKLVSIPESGMGFHLVDIELENGIILPNMLILNREDIVLTEATRKVLECMGARSEVYEGNIKDVFQIIYSEKK